MQPQTALFHSFLWLSSVPLGFPRDSVVNNTPANAGDVSSVPGLERSPGKGRANPLQYFYRGNPTGRGAWQAAVHVFTEESGTA